VGLKLIAHIQTDFSDQQKKNIFFLSYITTEIKHAHTHTFTYKVKLPEMRNKCRSEYVCVCVYNIRQYHNMRDEKKMKFFFFFFSLR